MVTILTLGIENGILVLFGMDFARAVCLFVCLAYSAGPYLAQILLRFSVRRYQCWGVCV